MSNIDNTNVSKVLGRIVDYPQQYDKSILVREPRSSNRVHLNIKDDQTPFDGYDVWNAYEVSSLTMAGLPVAGTMKIVYPATNSYIVESKSLKLYLNSFNMFRCGENPNDVVNFLCNTISKDLSELLETDVKCQFFTTRNVLDSNIKDMHWWEDYNTLEDTIDCSNIVFDQYQEDRTLLRSSYKYAESQWMKFHSSLLKSNCRVTRQPDWGDVFIEMLCKDHVDPISLLKYIVSFRDECHFHEEICETIFTRLNDTFKPDVLMVKCLYTRRGGIDICPVRYKGGDSIDLMQDTFIDITTPYIKTPRQ